MIGFGLPGGWEWLIILAAVLLIFGNKIPSVARNLGSGITQFKRGLKDDVDANSALDDGDSNSRKSESSNASGNDQDSANGGSSR
jgi:sec-independent protein translocase protein TatA